MEIKVEPKVMELLCSRLCHDLIGPVTAINNGIELITEFGDEMRGEAMSLMADSAREGSRRLQFYRIAFGFGGDAPGSGVGLGDARARALDLLADGRITLDWPEIGAPSDLGLPRGGVKLLLNLILVGVEALAGSGTVSVRLNAVSGGVTSTVTARSDKAGLSDELLSTLSGELPVEDLTPHTVQLYYTYMLAAGLGSVVETSTEPGEFGLVCRLQGVG
jgi:histidine phosphotransferase ChpT